MKGNRPFISAGLMAVFIILMVMLPVEQTEATQTGGIYRSVFQAGDLTLVVELLDDDLAHFEMNTAAGEAIWTSPMVAKTDYAGPSAVTMVSEGVIETPDMRLKIDPETLCLAITDLTRQPEVLLTTLCVAALPDEPVELTFTPEGTTDVYGLGQHFQRRGDINDNWFGQRRLMLNAYGNELTSFNGGNVGNTQIPIIYALGEGTQNYALFVDEIHWQYWSFTGDPFELEVQNLPLRWYVMTGSNLADLRQDYMELTGRPPVPPRQMFGLWVSEYGYENWDELTGVLDSLQAANFPLDGFVLDLQWFGGITPKADSQMGSLAWDEANFPDPARFINHLRQEYGIGIMTIEESYVSEGASNYDEALAAGVLLRRCEMADCDLIVMDEWWGKGGMVDWSNPAAAEWWHDHRRQHLIDAGVMAHWTDLGEPEIYDEIAWYYGFPELEQHNHADVHNVYNLLWSKSIWEGYQRNGVERRPFILSRSGTAGSQRYGVAMWSGDIGANMPSLTAQMNVQAQMALSGIDYFGSDIGGFYRQAGDPLLDADEMYTLWLANSALLDVPLRPHAANLQNAYETAPSLIGDVASNLENVRLRYELSPYLYTLAHEAYRTGAPVFPPPVYYFQEDPNARKLASQKMIGPLMMMATVTGYNTEAVMVYLPAGGWFNYLTNEFIESAGEWIEVPTLLDGLVRVPLFVRTGAIIPQMPVDEQTFNMLGQRRDGSSSHDLIIRAYGGQAAGSFRLIEDDGETMAYQNGMVRETQITQGAVEGGWFIEVVPSGAGYAGEPEQRGIEVRLIDPTASVGAVTLNGEVLPLMGSLDEFDAAAQGWMVVEPGQIRVKAGMVETTASLRFEFMAGN